MRKIIKINYLLNSPILTAFGQYEYLKYDKEAHELDLSGAVSAIGHEGTAKVLSLLLGTPVEANRIRIEMKPGERALVFSLKERLPEGAVLSEDELRAMPHELGILVRKN